MCYIALRTFSTFQTCLNNVADTNYEDCINVSMLSNMNVGSFNDRLRVHGTLKAVQWLCAGAGAPSKESRASQQSHFPQRPFASGTRARAVC